MQKIRATLVPVIEVHHLDLERLVKLVYGFDISFKYATRHPDGCGVEYAVDGNLNRKPTWTAQAADLRSGKRSRSIDLILNTLASDGHIHRGRWIVLTGSRRKEHVAENVIWAGKNVDLRVAVGSVS